jgi:diguanylate cyclase (GGDEF)-like protein
MIFKDKAQELAKQIELLKLLHIIGLEIVAATDLDKLLSLVVKQTRSVLGYDNFAVFLAEGDNLVLKSTSYFPKKLFGLKIPIGKGVVGKCAEEGSVIIIGNVEECDYYIRSGLDGVKSEIAAPIMFGPDLVGVVTVEGTKLDAFGEEDERVMSILSAQLGVAIRNLQMTGARIRELELLHHIGLKIASKTDREDLLSTVVRYMGRNLGFDYSGIFLLEGEKLVLRAHSSLAEPMLGQEIDMGKGIVGRCAEKNEIIIMDDVSQCDDYIPSGLKGAKSAIALPLLHEERLLGVLGSESRLAAAYAPDDIRVLGILSAQIGQALRNSQMLGDLQKMAIMDELTGLFNYRHFRERLDEEIQRARRYGRDLSLILLDIDNFKSINDTYGHAVGNDVLAFVAATMRQHTRRVDNRSVMKDARAHIPARFGGDEFMVILPETGLSGAMVVAERLRTLIPEACSKEFGDTAEGKAGLEVQISLGLTCLKTDKSVDDIMERVSEALSEAKKKGKNGIVVKK